MTARITNAGANHAGAWAFYSDGTEYRYSVATNQTIVSSLTAADVVVEGRFGC